MTYFIDTNFFLQCRKYDQLKWNEITTDKDITILITRPVQIEIDKLKNDGNTRRAKRARETTSLFRRIIDEDSLSLVVVTPENNITIKFANQYPDEQLVHLNPSLNISNNDDKILAILHCYLLESSNNKSCAFLSNDTNPILTAKINNLPAIQIPDTWLLEPENDERDKEIIKLKQQISEYQKKEPIIEVEFKTNDYISSIESVNEFDVKIHMYKQIDQSDEIEKFVCSFVKKHPKQTDFSVYENGLTRSMSRITHPMQTYNPPSNDRINEYNKKYEIWKESIYELISGYADKKNKFTYIFPFHIAIKNNGNVPAENLLLDFNVLSGGKLITPDFNDEVFIKRWAYPAPPKPPVGKWKYIFMSPAEEFFTAQASIMRHNITIPPVTLLDRISSLNRDKNTFYWKNGKPKKNITSWRFTCEEFRHKLDNEEFKYYLIFDEDIDKMIFQVIISASNMSFPVKTIYTLNKKYTYVEIQADILYLLKYGVTEDMMENIEGKHRKDNE